MIPDESKGSGAPEWKDGPTTPGESSFRRAGRGLTRRRALGGAALVGVGAGIDRLLLGASSSSLSREVELTESIPFYGRRQSGIATPAQEYLSFAAFDVTATATSDLQQLLRAWTTATASLAAGDDYQGQGLELDQGPVDPGEADGLGPARLTITFGFGASLFVGGGGDRFDLRTRMPPALEPLPSFQGETLDPSRSDGDLCIQVCAEHPQVVFHATHLLTRLAAPWATLRWQQLGFGRTSSTSRDQQTPRNLMGFKDGTANIRAEDEGDMEDYVWVQPADGPDWMTGGSYLVSRRIRILFDVWDATSLEGQERVIGREKSSGAPLGGRREYDPVDLNAVDNGQPTIPVDAHIRVTSPQENGGQRILRRGYSYAEPPEPGSGQMDGGLFFIAFQRDPRRQFVPIQGRLARDDALNHHAQHTASALFACPPGVLPGEFVGEGLFA